MPPGGQPPYGAPGQGSFGGPQGGAFPPPGGGYGGQPPAGQGGPAGQDFGGQLQQGFNQAADAVQQAFNPQQPPYGQPPYGQQPYPNQALAPMGAYPQGGPMVQVQAQPGQHGPKGQVKNPTTELILGLVTCGIYQFIWFIRVCGEMSAFVQRDEPSWPKLLGLSFITCGLYGLYWQIVTLGPLVQEIQYRAGVSNPQNHGLMYLVPYYNVILLQQELNRAWQGPA